MNSSKYLIVAIAIFILLPNTTVSAHTPLFAQDNFELQSAYTINDPSKSWAIYANLPSIDQAAYYQFQMDLGGKIDITLLTAQDPSQSHFLPSFALMVPELSHQDVVPSFVDIPFGYGVMVVEGTDPGGATYEAFAPGWFYQLANVTIIAPVSGIYYVAVYDTDYTGNYGLPVGYLEGFTIPDILILPYDLLLVFQWEGQNMFLVLLPMILALALGGTVLYWYNIKGKGPKHSVSKWLAAFGGLAFLGSAGINLYQMSLALSITGWVQEALFSIIFIAVPLILSILALRYAFQDKAKLTIWYRLGLIVIGMIGLMLWTGLYLGPLFLIAAALMPPYSKGK